MGIWNFLHTGPNDYKGNPDYSSKSTKAIRNAIKGEAIKTRPSRDSLSRIERRTEGDKRK